MNPAAVQSLGNYAGLDFELEDKSAAGHDVLLAARNQLMAAAANDPRLSGMNDEPEYEVDIDYLNAAALGVTAVISMPRANLIVWTWARTRRNAA